MAVNGPLTAIRVNGYSSLYVDDFLTAGTSPNVLNLLGTYLKTCVQELSISPLLNFLAFPSCATAPTAPSRFISPSVRLSPRTLPADPIVNLYTTERTSLPDLRGITGFARWLADHIRSDFQFMVSQLGSAAANPGPAHTKAAQYLVFYHNPTREIKFHLAAASPYYYTPS